MFSDMAPSSAPGKDIREAEPGLPKTGRCNVLILSFLSFVLIVFGLWVVIAGKRYRAEYAQAMEGWRVGSTRVVELTIVKDDKHNLGCAADHDIEGLRCSHRQDSQPVGMPADDAKILKPYNTVGNELLLGAGLWNAPDLQGTLPESRFTVVCNYHINGVMKSALIRFDPNAVFSPLGKTVTTGKLTDCVIPR